MKENSNLQIVKRMAELAANPLVYNVYPNPDSRKEYIFLANTFQYAITNYEREFDEFFQKCVGNYKSTLEQGKGYGWFHQPERLVWIRSKINQLMYVVYGERFVREIRFKEKLGKEAYLDLINQIDRTALMTPEELKAFHDELADISKDVVAKILAEEKQENTTLS